MTVLDLFGYLGSVLVALSLMMSNIKRLRWINLVGAFVFSSYGFLIDAYPVFILNGWIVLVDIYYLVRIYQFKDNFDMVKLSSVHTPLFELLMDRYGQDIRQYFPDTSKEQLEDAVALLIFRNMKPVGLFAYRRFEKEPATVNVLMDYVIPESRDMKTAQYLFDRHRTQLRADDINTLVSHTNNENHIRYLCKMGFQKTDEGYTLDLR